MTDRFLFILASVGLVLLGCSNDGTTGSTVTTLAAQCIEDATDLEEIDWLCPDDLTVECNDHEADPERIYLEPSGELPESCEDIELSLNDEGPFEVGTHDIVVTATADGAEGQPVEVACESTLTVVDTVPPSAEGDTPTLWPPNHKFHTITGADCVADACDESVRVVFVSASSDEPMNARGDGNTEPDIILGCDHVQLRSERQGGSNGRVYTLRWRAVDDSGNESDGECVVTVHHDQSGRQAIDDGPAYTVTLDEEECDDGAGGAGGDGGSGGIIVP